MSSFDSQRQQESSLKRGWPQNLNHPNSCNNKPPILQLKPNLPSCCTGFDQDQVGPHVTVVLEGRSICQLISLHQHGSYQSLAMALRQMFMGIIIDQNSSTSFKDNISSINLSNAVPGHLVAYEDMENDLLLVGDLNWKDFVRVAKRIRILPAKNKSRKQQEESKGMRDLSDDPVHESL